VPRFPCRDPSGFPARCGGAGHAAGRYPRRLGWSRPAETDHASCGDPSLRTDRATAERLLAYTAKEPLAPFQGPAQAACLALLSLILRTDAGEAPAPSSGALKPISDHLADLCRYGTGWLGWPPSEVWNASPAELEAAILAHFDRLVKMTPGGDAPQAAASKDAQRQANIAAGLDPEFDRDGLRALKAKHNA
jgi:hypothetical protein